MSSLVSGTREQISGPKKAHVQREIWSVANGATAAAVTNSRLFYDIVVNRHVEPAVSSGKILDSRVARAGRRRQTIISTISIGKPAGFRSQLSDEGLRDSGNARGR